MCDIDDNKNCRVGYKTNRNIIIICRSILLVLLLPCMPVLMKTTSQQAQHHRHPTILQRPQIQFTLKPDMVRGSCSAYPSAEQTRLSCVMGDKLKLGQLHGRMFWLAAWMSYLLIDPGHRTTKQRPKRVLQIWRLKVEHFATL